MYKENNGDRITSGGTFNIGWGTHALLIYTHTHIHAHVYRCARKTNVITDCNACQYRRTYEYTAEV